MPGRKFHLSTHYVIFNWISGFDFRWGEKRKKFAEFFMNFPREKKVFRSSDIEVILLTLFFLPPQNKLYSVYFFTRSLMFAFKLCKKWFQRMNEVRCWHLKLEKYIFVIENWTKYCSSKTSMLLNFLKIIFNIKYFQQLNIHSMKNFIKHHALISVLKLLQRIVATLGTLAENKNYFLHFNFLNYRC